MSKKIFFSAYILICFFLCACSDDASSPQQRRDHAVPVRVAEVLSDDVDQILNVIGHVEASATVKVTAQVGGQLLEAKVRPGHQVKAGALLFRIDPRSFQASLNQADAALASNSAQLRRARQDLARYKKLASQDFLSQQQYEQSLTEVETIEASIEQNSAVRANALLNLEHADIKAPIAGRVGEVLVDPGNNIKANDATLLVINTISPADVKFSVPERFLPELNRRFRAGKVEVRVLPEGDSGPPVAGALTVIDNEVDRTTGTISMRARFANTDERLWPGQFTRVSIVMEAVKNALVIPDTAIMEGTNGRYVYVLQEDGTVKNRDVAAEDLPDGRVLVTSGLALGERVVVDGQLNLMPGVKVEVIKPSGGQGPGPGSEPAGARGAGTGA